MYNTNNSVVVVVVVVGKPCAKFMLLLNCNLCDLPFSLISSDINFKSIGQCFRYASDTCSA